MITEGMDPPCRKGVSQHWNNTIFCGVFMTLLFFKYQQLISSGADSLDSKNSNVYSHPHTAYLIAVQAVLLFICFSKNNMGNTLSDNELGY